MTRPGGGRPARVLGLSWVGWLNFILLQWVGIRLAYVVDGRRITRWYLLRWIVPLTGWWSHYLYVGRSA